MALLLAPIATAICGVLMDDSAQEGTCLRHMGELILTLGVAQIVLAAVKSIWARRAAAQDAADPGRANRLGGLNYPIYRLFIIGLALVIMAIMAMLLYKTRLGKIVRAAVSDAGMVNASASTSLWCSWWCSPSASGWPALPASPSPDPDGIPRPGRQVGMDAFIVVVTAGSAA